MRTLINVCGASRSGTTMLHLMLANGPEAFACGEVYARFRPWRPHHTDLRCACGDRPCALWETLADADETSFHRRVLGLPGIDVAVDCSKRVDWIVDANRWAEEAGIRVANILIWKEPQDMAYSIWRRNGHLDSWPTSFLRYHGRFLDTGLPFVSTCYTDLVERPARELAALCQRVGIRYRPGRENFWLGHHHHLFGNGGVLAQLGRSDGAVRLDRDFPPAFVRDYEDAAPTPDQAHALRATFAELRARAVL